MNNRSLRERERRLNMRNLFSRLFDLLPPQPTKMSISDMLEIARKYVNQLQTQLEELKQRKMQLEGEVEALYRMTNEPMSPVLNIISDSNSTMRVNFITGSNMKFSLSEIISAIEEQGAEVIGLTYNNAGNMNILSIHCQAICSRIGIESGRLLERLKTLIEECM